MTGIGPGSSALTWAGRRVAEWIGTCSTTFAAAPKPWMRGRDSMICKPCRDRHHHECRGGSWCDCQHGQYGSTLTTQQRNDLAVYGTVLPSIPITVTQQAGNGQAG